MKIRKHKISHLDAAHMMVYYDINVEHVDLEKLRE